jgi:PAS domain S-box-containing protein
MQRADGTICYIYAEGRVIIGEDGQPERMVGIGQDITERLRMESALRESRDMFENLFESAPDGTVLTDEAGRIVRVNRQAEQMFGYAREQLVNQPLEMLLPDRYQERHVHHRKAFNRDPHTRLMSQAQELYGRRKDGSEFPVDIMLSPVQSDGNLQVIAVVRDITERRRSEEALRQSEARFRSIFEGAALGMALVDLEGRLLVSNPRLSEILGYSTDELRGMNSLAITHPADADATSGLYQDLIEGRREVGQVEKRYIRKDGQVIWGALTISLVRNRQGNPHFAIAMVEDITPRKQMEAELAEVQFRLMAGREQERTQLAQELHDVPLQDLYVLLYGLNEFEDALGDAEQLRSLKNEYADGLRNVITTLRGIMGELRSPTLSPFGLAGAIREHADLFASKNPQLKLHLDLMADEQVLPEDARLNLFRIYQQALSNVIRHAQASTVNVRFYYDEHWIQLEIEDDGLGFTVPRRWIGLAREGHLGLAGSAERAEIIGGHFQVISAPGRGTRIRVEVPREKQENLIP